jgi:N-acetylglucosamine kinase-like BadF-type ATPase
MRAVLGVDGGNTKTAALVLGLDGKVLGCALGGCGDIYGVASASTAIDTVERTALTAMKRTSLRPRDLVAAAFGMAGADWPEDFSFIRAEIGKRGLARHVTVVNDAVGALHAGSLDGTGVAVVCGTFVAMAAGGRMVAGGIIVGGNRRVARANSVTEPSVLSTGPSWE